MVRLAIALLCATARAGPLSDEPLHGQGNKVYPIGSSGWTASLPPFSMPATVPGELVSDLEASGGYGDPLFHLNWRNASYDGDGWSYSTTFDAPGWGSSSNDNATTSAAAAGPDDTLLVFDSVKMGATVTLNGAQLGVLQNQFLRYNFSVGTLLKPTGNALRVAFAASTDALNFEGRFQACSGGWDWAPYSTTATAQADPTFSRGMLRDVYLVPVRLAVLAHVVPLITYTGVYPTAPLADGGSRSGGARAAPFAVSVDVVLWAPQAVAAGGALSVTQTWDPTAKPTELGLGALPAGESVVRLSLPPTPAGGVKLWWPSGVRGSGGGPKLRNNTAAGAMYSLSVAYRPKVGDGGNPSVADRAVGFRVAHLVTTNDTACAADAASGGCAAAHGSGDFTMRLKVNGADLWSRGANVIPMEEMEAREALPAYRAMLMHAASAGHNTVRVWGGGKFLPAAFYDACDEMGLMVIHDLMYGTPWFGGNGSIPVDTPLQRAEVAHNVRRLHAHPSIVMWTGGNEFRGTPQYADAVQHFIGPSIANVTGATVVVWPYSPSGGWLSGVNRLTGLPDGSPFKFAGATDGEKVGGGFGVVQRACASGACQTIAGIDYNNGFKGKSPKAATADECCALCVAAPKDCWAATLYHGVCYFKPAGGTNQAAGSDTLVVFPNGHTPPPLPPHTIETHGPYQHGAGFLTRNGKATLDLFPANIPPTLHTETAAPGAFGPQQRGTYASEFGASVFSSFESMAPTLDPATDWSAHATVMKERNYPADNFVQVYFGTRARASLNASGALAMQRVCWFQMIAQMLQQKSDIEARRSANAQGTVTWQLNEIWPTGGWGSLEYGTVGYTDGQVLGGRWKPMHYQFESHLYRDAVIICGDAASCLLKNDNPLKGFTGSWATELWKLGGSGATATHTPVKLGGGAVDLARGSGAAAWVCADGSGAPPCKAGWGDVLAAHGCAKDGSDCVLSATLTDSSGTAVDTHVDLLTTPAQLALPPAAVEAVVAPALGADGSATVTLSANATALLVTLTTGEQGVWSENVLALPAGASRRVTLQPIAGAAPIDIAALAKDLRVEHVAMYGPYGPLGKL